MADDFPITIFHNPACGTSRTALAILREAGRELKVVEYLKTGWTKAGLKALLAKAGLAPGQAARRRNLPEDAAAALERATSDDALLDAMVAYPILVERPLVETPKGVKLCRPAETARTLLP